ncbi:MAG: hypothetical protein WCH20_16260 [Nitrospira sp.]
MRRRVRPSTDQTFDELERGQLSGTDPASAKVKHHPVDLEAHARFSAKIKAISPEKR